MVDENPVGQIRPTTFKPSEPAATFNRFRLSKRQLTLAALLLVLVGGLWFSFTAKSVRFIFEPDSAEVIVSGGFELTALGYRLLREGDYQVSATAPGYSPLKRRLTVGSKRNQTFNIELTKLPGRVGFNSEPPGATIFRNGISPEHSLHQPGERDINARNGKKRSIPRREKNPSKKYCFFLEKFDFENVFS